MEKPSYSLRVTRAVAFVAVAALSLAMPGCGEGRSADKEVQQKSAARADEAAAAGRPAFDFKIKTFDGAYFDLAAAKGRPVVINFWASWCGPCRLEAPLFNSAHRYYGDKVEFVGISIDDDDAGARKFIAEYGWKFKSARDADNSLEKAYRVRAIPMTFIVDAKGVVSYVHLGLMDGDVLQREVDRLL